MSKRYWLVILAVIGVVIATGFYTAHSDPNPFTIFLLLAVGAVVMVALTGVVFAIVRAQSERIAILEEECWQANKDAKTVEDSKQVAL